MQFKNKVSQRKSSHNEEENKDFFKYIYLKTEKKCIILSLILNYRRKQIFYSLSSFYIIKLTRNKMADFMSSFVPKKGLQNQESTSNILQGIADLAGRRKKFQNALAQIQNGKQSSDESKTMADSITDQGKLVPKVIKKNYKYSTVKLEGSLLQVPRVEKFHLVKPENVPPSVNKNIEPTKPYVTINKPTQIRSIPPQPGIIQYSPYVQYPKIVRVVNMPKIITQVPPQIQIQKPILTQNLSVAASPPQNQIIQKPQINIKPPSKDIIYQQQTPDLTINSQTRIVSEDLKSDIQNKSIQELPKMSQEQYRLKLGQLQMKAQQNHNLLLNQTKLLQILAEKMGKGELPKQNYEKAAEQIHHNIDHIQNNIEIITTTTQYIITSHEEQQAQNNASHEKKRKRRKKVKRNNQSAGNSVLQGQPQNQLESNYNDELNNSEMVSDDILNLEIGKKEKKKSQEKIQSQVAKKQHSQSQNFLNIFNLASLKGKQKKQTKQFEDNGQVNKIQNKEDKSHLKTQVGMLHPKILVTKDEGTQQNPEGVQNQAIQVQTQNKSKSHQHLPNIFPTVFKNYFLPNTQQSINNIETMSAINDLESKMEAKRIKDKLENLEGDLSDFMKSCQNDTKAMDKIIMSHETIVKHYLSNIPQGIKL